MLGSSGCRAGLPVSFFPLLFFSFSVSPPCWHPCFSSFPNPFFVFLLLRVKKNKKKNRPLRPFPFLPSVFGCFPLLLPLNARRRDEVEMEGGLLFFFSPFFFSPLPGVVGPFAFPFLFFTVHEEGKEGNGEDGAGAFTSFFSSGPQCPSLLPLFSFPPICFSIGRLF